MATPDTTGMRADIAAALATLQAAPRPKELRSLENQLADGEQVRRLARGYYRSGIGLLALTDRRLLFVRDGLLAKTSEDFPFTRIASIACRHHRLGASDVIIAASGNAEKITQVNRSDSEALVNEARHLVGAPTSAPASEAAADIPTQLRQLADLRDSGVISPDEFAAKKAELLARM